MKRILFFFALLTSLVSNAQIRVCQLPQVSTGTTNDWIIKEDSSCNGTRKIKVSDFISYYGLGGGTTVDTTSLSNRIDVLTNSKVDSLYRNSTRDSIVYLINGRRHAIKDSIGTPNLDPPASISVDQTDAVDMESGATSFPVENQTYIIGTLGITGIGYIRTVGVVDHTTGNPIFSRNAEAWVDALSRYVPCTYDVATNTAGFDYLLWAGHVSQAGTSAPTIDLVNYNISGETPTLGYVSDGRYSIAFTSGKLVSADATKHFSFIYDGEAQGFYTIDGVSGTDAEIKCFRSGAYADDRLDRSYIEIRLVYTL